MLTTSVSGQCNICGDNFVVGDPSAVVFGANGDICTAIAGDTVPPQVCTFLSGFFEGSALTCGTLDARGDEIPAAICPLLRVNTIDICACQAFSPLGGSFSLSDIIAVLRRFFSFLGLF